MTRDEIAYALQVARDRGFRKVKVGLGDVVFSAKLGESALSDDDDGHEETPEQAVKATVVQAPAVGFFRTASSPIEIGHEVHAGDVVGEVIALGIANDVVSAVSGKVAELKVASGDAVEFGQALVVLETV